ncbi:MAG TPA: hypothetical protein VKX49_25635, partial [Bryobacteraceae bacterium]|nr:hypothetical protein [Bryobacteraceae bacterium]
MKPPTALTHLCAIAWVVLIGFAAAAAGAVHTRIFGHDIFVFLDAGWRVLNGQRPEVDFNPSMGALMAWFAAAGLKLSGNSVNGIGYMSGLIAFIAGAWAYALTRRMSGLASVLAAGVIALIAAAPFPTGWMPNVLSHAMVYNRYGYALLGLVVLECFLGVERGFAAGLSSGILCVSLLFVKPSYCLAGVVLVCGSFFVQKNSWRRTSGLAIGAAAAGVAIMALLQFDLGALWADLRLMGSARGAGLSLWNLRWAFLKGTGEFLPLAMLAVLVAAIR